jgi:sugar lactone lactonase YvrE
VTAVRVAVPGPDRLGEGPFWHPLEQALWWCDIPARAIRRHDPATGVTRSWTLAADVGSFAPRRDGTLVVALRDGLVRFDPDGDGGAGAVVERLAGPPYDPREQRFNDGKCDPAGRFWVGSMDEPRRPGTAALFCWSEGRLAERQAGITISNGLAWSPDGRTMHWTDTTAHTVRAFDFDASSGAMWNGRDFATFPKRAEGQPLDAYGGRPDGAAMDAEGCYWVAMYEGARVLRLSPAGETLAEVRLPARCPTMPCFGGPDLRTVYVTSASVNRPERERETHPANGAVLAFEVDVPGLPVDFAAAD